VLKIVDALHAGRSHPYPGQSSEPARSIARHPLSTKYGVETESARVYGGIMDAKIGGKSDHEDLAQTTVAQIAGEAISSARSVASSG
jgi:hypothetical protein